jgi:hypothetical protein
MILITLVSIVCTDIIDMIMTSDPNKIIEHGVKAVGIADHCLVYCVTSYKSCVPTQGHRTIEMRNFKNFNVDDFLLDLELSMDLCGGTY